MKPALTHFSLNRICIPSGKRYALLIMIKHYVNNYDTWNECIHHSLRISNVEVTGALYNEQLSEQSHVT